MGDFFVDGANCYDKKQETVLIPCIDLSVHNCPMPLLHVTSVLAVAVARTSR